MHPNVDSWAVLILEDWVGIPDRERLRGAQDDGMACGLSMGGPPNLES